jgi:hypothetical protein
MTPRDAPPPWITYFDVAPPPPSYAEHYYLAPRTPRGSGQVATRCHHPDCANGDADGHLIGVDLVMAGAERRAWAHSKRHQPPDQAS